MMFVKSEDLQHTEIVVEHIQHDHQQHNATNDSTADALESSDDSTPPQQALTESQTTLNAFWPTITDEIKRIKSVDAKNQVLPLARIKKIMKLDEDVKMISAEAPLLFAKAAEIFIHELTLRAWVHTEDNKRRTLQRNDIAMAITKYDQFDFLIDIVPRDEIVKLPRRHETTSFAGSSSSSSAAATTTTTTTMMTTGATSAAAPAAGATSVGLGETKPVLVDGVLQTQMSGGTTVVQTNEPVQYYLQLAQQHQQALTQQQQHQQQQQVQQHQQQQQQHQQQHSLHVMQTATPAAHQHQQPQQHQIQHLQMATGLNGGITLGTPQNILLAQPHQQHQHIQLVQQIVTPSGEIQHVPIQLPQNQLNMLRMQMQQQHQHHQPIILQTSPMQGQQILQLQQSPQQQMVNGAGGLFINASAAQQQQLQQQQQQAQQQQQQSDD